jgi:hypothetical protein
MPSASRLVSIPCRWGLVAIVVALGCGSRPAREQAGDGGSDRPPVHDASTKCTQSTSERLGLPRAAYGVWDRSGYLPIAEHPFLRGQGYLGAWGAINPAKGSFSWSELDRQLRFADSQDQYFSIQISPIGGPAGSSMPRWLFAEGVPEVTDGTYTYGHYLDAGYKQAFSEMVRALARHVRLELPEPLRSRVSYVRCDTGATGDEAPYEEPDSIPAGYRISDRDWTAFRLWAFEVYRSAFQDGEGPAIPILFQDVESTGYPDEWSWVSANVRGGLGVKFGGQVRGHHLTESRQVAEAFKAHVVDSDRGMFSRNEMDQTWRKPYFQLNVRLSMYWAAVEQLHAGLGIWDVTESCLAAAGPSDFSFVFDFFSLWAAELDPATAAGGFSILHEGLDSSDVVRFPESEYGAAKLKNTSRYTKICEDFAGRGARMDDPESATAGQVAQRDKQAGWNDAGWQIVSGNYERFLTQLSPESTSVGLWRVNGPLTAASHPYDRFARRFDHASGRDTMAFDVHDRLLPSAGLPVRISVEYLDRGTGRFALQYDAVSDAAKTAFVVTKANSNAWKTESVVVTDWALANRGPGGADLALVNVDADDDVFHGLEIRKLGAPCEPP